MDKLQASALALIMTISTMGPIGPSYAQTVNIDFNDASSPTYNGLGAAPDSPANVYWNGINTSGSAPHTGSNLVASDGTTVTTVGISTLGLSWDLVTSSAANALLRDFVYGPGSVTALPASIDGLNPDGHYNLYFYGVAGDVQSGWHSAFTVNGTTLTTTGGLAETTILTFSEDYVVFKDVQASPAGVIAFTFGGPGSGSFSPFNGLQIQAVPLPGAAWLLGSALAGLGYFGKRRNTSD